MTRTTPSLAPPSQNFRTTRVRGRLTYIRFNAHLWQGYDFDYKVVDGRGNTHYHKAEADAKGTVRGTCGYKEIQGVYRVVDYMADASGFHAKIKTNELGTDGKSPA
ncbi:hypothetical protein AVEN_198324-1 [Araneus ventricosus]|uniref:Cuticle protein 16.8 n=1 Tax=Araneus ventricosus TaxID=182803 RepID=A0A4Y2JXT6_ARAVE|nr:hypothetical protein AVEN_198324-1 [Araneus ventricosus]